MSQVEYGQSQLEQRQRKDHHEMTVTTAQLAVFGQQTTAVLEQLRAEGFEFEQWLPSGPAS